MTQLSRRRFMQLAGITLAGGYFDLAQFWTRHPAVPAEVYGRALVAASVYAQPRTEAPAISRLWPDSIVSLRALNGEWYRTEQGYVQRCDVQPVALYPVTPSSAVPPFWAEVASPVAPVGQWCAADAPPVTRIGHGGVAYVTGYLPGDSQNGAWYSISDNAGQFLGWSQAIHWQQIPSTASYGEPFALEIHQRRGQLRVLDGQRTVLQAPVSIGRTLAPGRYPLKRQQPGAPPVQIAGQAQMIYAAPWQFSIGSVYTASGVYWHNRLGQPIPGPDVQFTALLARWLYHHSLVDNAFVTVV